MFYYVKKMYFRSDIMELFFSVRHDVIVAFLGHKNNLSPSQKVCFFLQMKWCRFLGAFLFIPLSAIFLKHERCNYGNELCRPTLRTRSGHLMKLEMSERRLLATDSRDRRSDIRWGKTNRGEMLVVLKCLWSQKGQNCLLKCKWFPKFESF